MLNNVVPTPKKIEKSEGIISIPFAISSDVKEWDIYMDTFIEIFEKMFQKSLVKSEDGIRLVYNNDL